MGIVAPPKIGQKSPLLLVVVRLSDEDDIKYYASIKPKHGLASPFSSRNNRDFHLFYKVWQTELAWPSVVRNPAPFDGDRRQWIRWLLRQLSRSNRGCPSNKEVFIRIQHSVRAGRGDLIAMYGGMDESMEVEKKQAGSKIVFSAKSRILMTMLKMVARVFAGLSEMLRSLPAGSWTLDFCLRNHDNAPCGILGCYWTWQSLGYQCLRDHHVA